MAVDRKENDLVQSVSVQAMARRIAHDVFSNGKVNIRKKIHGTIQVGQLLGPEIETLLNDSGVSKSLVDEQTITIMGRRWEEWLDYEVGNSSVTLDENGEITIVDGKTENVSFRLCLKPGLKVNMANIGLH